MLPAPRNDVGPPADMVYLLGIVSSPQVSYVIAFTSRGQDDIPAIVDASPTAFPRGLGHRLGLVAATHPSVSDGVSVPNRLAAGSFTSGVP